MFFPEHHLRHTASAFFPSPFDDALMLTLDGVGEWATATISVGEGRTLELALEPPLPAQPRSPYSAFTYFTGFQGEQRRVQADGACAVRRADVILEHLVDLKEDGSVRLNMGYFGYLDDVVTTNEKLPGLAASG